MNLLKKKVSDCDLFACFDRKSQFLILISYLDNRAFQLIKLTNSPEENNDIQFTYMYHVHTKLGPSHHQFMFINN